VAGVPDRLAQAMQTLYAAGPDEFMALRKRLVAEAKADQDMAVAGEIGKLRKPSVAAWAVNLVARTVPEVVDELVDLGGQMRDAQSRLDATALTGMRKERDAAVEAFVRAATVAVDEEGRRLAPAAQQEVRATAIAALADERATEAIASGQLTRALSYSGFGEVDLAEALARTSGGAILTVVPGGSTRSDDTSRAMVEDKADAAAPTDEQRAAALAAAERDLAQAERDLTTAEQAVAQARERAEETRERLAVVERQLAKAREADERALEAVTDAVRARKLAEATRHTAQEKVAKARKAT
jgi:hypothetical protein